jgi:triosephosphate isomerase
MLKSVGAQHVLIGHSERRAIFGATEEHINEQMHKALSEGIQPLLCIGETKDEYEAGINTKICAVQVHTLKLNPKPQTLNPKP